MDTKELEAQLFELRDRYDALVSQRIEHLTLTGYFETAAPDQCNNECTEIWALEEWMKELRNKLTVLDPEKYHFGKMIGKKKKNPSVKGDYGYYYCKECKGIFKFQDYKKEKSLYGNEKESFCKCAEHKGRKLDGTIKLKTEELQWL